MPALAEDAAAGLDALHRLKTAEAPLYLTPSPELSSAARLASKYLFSSVKPYTPKSPFNQLLTDGFDAEQIWQQIDLQAQPLLSSLRRHVRSFEKNPEEIEKQFNLGKASVRLETANEDQSKGGVDSESDDFEIDDDDEEEEDEELNGSEDDEDEEEDDEENSDEEDRETEKDEKKNANIVEDKFLKIKELEEYLVEDEAREYGEKKENKNSKRKRGKIADEDEDSEDEDVNEDEDDDDEDKDDELGLLGLDDDDGNEMENARYEDFFGGKKTVQKKKSRQFGGSDDDLDMDGDLDMDDDHTDGSNIQKKQSLSTHEKELEKRRSQIEEMEKANLEPKTWTMQGEVTADKRPKNSALDVHLDFQHNVRPAQVITEEVTASLEESIKKRIAEGGYNDAQKPPTLLAKGPREKKELDESKSKKGLAELYEDDYAQKTGLVSAALTFSDEQKKEASTLFKNLCVKLDALSHFHFTPKPVIEDMSIQANVPALAMEEIAPLAVSDAAMLAPEEVFSGKGDVKEESELTKEERKRRRANKKRKFKAKTAKQKAVKAQPNTVAENGPGDPL